MSLKECYFPLQQSCVLCTQKGGELQIVQDLRQIKKASYEDKYPFKDIQEWVDAIEKIKCTNFLNHGRG